jgi:hypothetical protein
MSFQYCLNSDVHKYIHSKEFLYCEKCGSYITIVSQNPKPNKIEPKNIIFSLENMGAKQIKGKFNGKTCLHGDDRNTHYSYAAYPTYLTFELPEAQFVNDCSGYLYNEDERCSSMLFEASLDYSTWDILHQEVNHKMNGKFIIPFEGKLYKYFRFSGNSNKNPENFVLNSLYIQYKE